MPGSCRKSQQQNIISIYVRSTDPTRNLTVTLKFRLILCFLIILHWIYALSLASTPVKNALPRHTTKGEKACHFSDLYYKTQLASIGFSRLPPSERRVEHHLLLMDWCILIYQLLDWIHCPNESISCIIYCWVYKPLPPLQPGAVYTTTWAIPS